jgi:hypothetical protein
MTAKALPHVGYLPLAWALGMACGVLLRDYRWFRAIRATWPFTDRVTDWNEIKRLAESDTPSNWG